MGLGLRDVGTQGVGAEGSSSGLIGAGARASAQGVVFAVAATAFELAGIVEGLEQRRVTIDLGHVVCADVSGGDGEEACRADLAGVGYEHDAVAVAYARSTQGPAALHLFAGDAHFSHALNGDTAVGRGFRGGDDEGCVAGNGENPGHQALAVLG